MRRARTPVMGGVPATVWPGERSPVLARNPPTTQHCNIATRVPRFDSWPPATFPLLGERRLHRQRPHPALFVLFFVLLAHRRRRRQVFRVLFRALQLLRVPPLSPPLQGLQTRFFRHLALTSGEARPPRLGYQSQRGGAACASRPRELRDWLETREPGQSTRSARTRRQPELLPYCFGRRDLKSVPVPVRVLPGAPDVCVCVGMGCNCFYCSRLFSFLLFIFLKVYALFPFLEKHARPEAR